MNRLEASGVLQRRIRKDDTSELAIPTWDLVAGAIKSNAWETALDLLDYTRDESRRNSDSLVSFVEMVLTHLAGFGEEEVARILMQRYSPRVAESLSAARTIEEALQLGAESQRGHHADFAIREESDKYVVTFDPCGSGGRLRRTRSVGATRKAYPWSWGKVGVPYYCCHCCISREILPIELVGYPSRVVLIGERPEDPCVHLFYKRPELIPMEYFERVGKKRNWPATACGLSDGR
ncbi:MAG: hypothetical protein HYX92_02060 [Chloroflexi bacterium]|nr:hypothetical protein [Chloroflexota bacterium]